MKILKLAIVELLRRPKKNGLLLLAIIIAVSLLTALSIVSGSANEAILEVISKTGHTLTIRPVLDSSAQGSGISDNLTTSEVVLGKYIPEELLPEIKKMYDKAIREGWEKKGGLVSRPGIGKIDLEPPTWAPRLYQKTMVQGGEVIVTGVEFYREYFVRFWWKLISGEWPEDATRVRLERETDAFLGGAFAADSGLNTGDTITIKDRKFTVMGVLEETNSLDDYMVFIPIRAAQKMFNKIGLVSLLSVRAMCPNCPVGDAMIEMNKAITGITAISQLDIADAQFNFFNMLYKFLLAVVIATIIVGIFSIFNIVTGGLYSRVKEIGTLKSVGASRQQLFRIFIYEHFIIGVAGGIGGYLIGVAFAFALNGLLAMGGVITLTPDFMYRALGLGTIVSLIAIIFPAFTISRMKITETFRTQWEN
jgi:putative ABC transport system permease protein